MTASSFHVFKEVYQRTKFILQVILHIKLPQAWKGTGCMWFLGWLDWNSGIYRRIMRKNFKKSTSLKRLDPQLIDLCLVVTYIIPAIHAPGVYTSHGVISFYWFKMGKTFKKIFSETMRPTACSPINSANQASWVYINQIHSIIRL